ncbi:MAG: 6,7-dimethyl-8-ribityllumazine synthase [Chloroflexi bacterium]|nr:6,7-dimethyl-8-ribityllumazine synthase [Chloroflexota bacterium]
MSAKKIAYIQPEWHSEITDACRDAFGEAMAGQGEAAPVIEYIVVPGSLEIPLMAKRLARTGQYAAVCCSGLVVDGGIYRHEFVAAAVLNGIVQVSLETDVPILSAVLTPHQFQGSPEHVAFFTTHMRTKGEELARACVAITARLEAVGSVGTP